MIKSSNNSVWQRIPFKSYQIELNSCFWRQSQIKRLLFNTRTNWQTSINSMNWTQVSKSELQKSIRTMSKLFLRPPLFSRKSVTWREKSQSFRIRIPYLRVIYKESMNFTRRRLLTTRNLGIDATQLNKRLWRMNNSKD